MKELPDPQRGLNVHCNQMQDCMHLGSRNRVWGLGVTQQGGRRREVVRHTPESIRLAALRAVQLWLCLSCKTGMVRIALIGINQIRNELRQYLARWASRNDLVVC